MDINNLYFYLLLGVFLYFLFTYVLENYLVEQENFDPSLVPVSSIVTLAKVAQKLVNGNGTLTNPGNLQIGKDMQATGNLTVTGKTAIGSTTMGDKTLNVTGTLGVSGDTTVGGNSTTNGNINIAAGTGINGINITSGNPYISFNKTGSTGQPQLYSDGTILHAYNSPFQVDQNLIVGGNTELSGVATPLLIKKGAVSPDNTKIQFGDGTGWRLRFQKDDANPIMDIVDNKNVDVHGKLKVTGDTVVSGDATINGKSILNGNTTIKNNLIICDPLAPTECVTLSYDSAKSMLTSNKGIKINNEINKPGLVTDSIVLTASGRVSTAAAKDGAGIEALATSVLNYPWIPNGSHSMIGGRTDNYDTQRWSGQKRAYSGYEGRINAMYYTGNEFGGYLDGK